MQSARPPKSGQSAPHRPRSVRDDQRLVKGEETRAIILNAALEVASRSGFEALTIGTLAERTGLSKSGLFAHFGSKLELQIATLDAAAQRFGQAVLLPALAAPRGLARLNAMFLAWVDWAETSQLPGGCPIYAAAIEYDDAPGPMRDAVIERWRAAEDSLARAVQMAVESGELAATTDVRQVCFELIGIVMASYQSRLVCSATDTKVLRSRAYERLIGSYLAQAVAAKEPALAERAPRGGRAARKSSPTLQPGPSAGAAEPGNSPSGPRRQRGRSGH